VSSILKEELHGTSLSVNHLRKNLKDRLKRVPWTRRFGLERIFCVTGWGRINTNKYTSCYLKLILNSNYKKGEQKRRKENVKLQNCEAPFIKSSSRFNFPAVYLRRRLSATRSPCAFITTILFNILCNRNEETVMLDESEELSDGVQLGHWQMILINIIWDGVYKHACVPNRLISIFLRKE